MKVVKISKAELIAVETIMPAPTVVFNMTKVLTVNERVLAFLGYRREELDIGTLKMAIHDDYKDKFKVFLDQFLRTGESHFKNEIKIYDKNHKLYWIKYDYTLVEYENEKFILGQLYDITELKETQKSMQKLINMEQAMLNITQSIIGMDNIHTVYETVLDTAIEYVNNAVVGTIMLKGQREDGVMVLVAQRGFEDNVISDFKLPVEQSFLYSETNGKMDQIVKIDNTFLIESVHKIPIKEGTTDYIRSTISAPIHIDGDFFGQVNVDGLTEHCFTEGDVKIIQFIRNNIEIALKNHKLYEEKMFLSRYDSLTQLYNRTYFEDLFAYVLTRANRYNESFNLVIFDINGLKFVNDNFGHLAGDQLIRNITDAWKGYVRESDILARYGGDEFVGVFFHTSPGDLHKKFDALVEGFSHNAMDLEGYEIKGSFAFGIATYGVDGTTEAELVKVADSRMYKNKMAFKMKYPII